VRLDHRGDEFEERRFVGRLGEDGIQFAQEDKRAVLQCALNRSRVGVGRHSDHVFRRGRSLGGRAGRRRRDFGFCLRFGRCFVRCLGRRLGSSRGNRLGGLGLILGSHVGGVLGERHAEFFQRSQLQPPFCAVGEGCGGFLGPDFADGLALAECQVIIAGLGDDTVDDKGEGVARVLAVGYCALRDAFFLEVSRDGLTARHLRNHGSKNFAKFREDPAERILAVGELGSEFGNAEFAEGRKCDDLVFHGSFMLVSEMAGRPRAEGERFRQETDGEPNRNVTYPAGDDPAGRPAETSQQLASEVGSHPPHGRRLVEGGSLLPKQGRTARGSSSPHDQLFQKSDRAKIRASSH